MTFNHLLRFCSQVYYLLSLYSVQSIQRDNTLDCSSNDAIQLRKLIIKLTQHFKALKLMSASFSWAPSDLRRRNCQFVTSLNTGLFVLHMNKHLWLLSTKTLSAGCLYAWLHAVGDPRRLDLRWSHTKCLCVRPR